MAEFWVLFFSEKDAFFVKEIAKEHKLPEDLVEKEFKAMLERIKNELQG